MRIDVDADRCVGAGQCVMAAPKVFDQNDDGTVNCSKNSL
ncbi:ferredoxin [Streptomyces canus]